MDGKNFEIGDCQKRCRHDQSDFPERVLMKHKSKITGDCRVHKSLNKKNIIRFQCSVEGAIAFNCKFSSHAVDIKDKKTHITKNCAQHITMK